jgi:hypothetical protein
MSDSNKTSHIRHYGAEEQADGSWLHNDGDVYWYNDKGDVHRADGPAVIRHDQNPNNAYPNDWSKLSWRFNGAAYEFNAWLKVTTVTDEQKLLLRLQYV